MLFSCGIEALTIQGGDNLYCVIQKVKNKKTSPYGAYKELKASYYTWTMDGETKTKYDYTYCGERFERPIKDAYKISIHESYRKNGKVKKKQWVICTMSYYEIADGWTNIDDYCNIDKKSADIGITVDEVYDLVYKKLDPLIEKIKVEFQQSEEYKTDQEHNAIINKYNVAKKEFEAKYGRDTYDYCYDVFGTLRNEEYLKTLERSYQAQEEFKKNYRSYYENNYSNYDNNSYSSYQGIKQSTYTENEKAMLKQIYRSLALKFHPDKNKGEGIEIMNLVNKLKEEWGI